MKKYILKVLHSILGNHLSYRLARSLYIYARYENGGNSNKIGEYRIQEELIKRLSLEEDELVIFDVGANIGRWTIALLNIFPSQKTNDLTIHAFEPISETFNILKNNIESHNHGKQVKLVFKACSNNVGYDQMFTSEWNSGSNSLYHQSKIHNGVCSHPVEKITLDKYCTNNNISKIHFIKSDTEGNEVNVIRGSKRLFEEEKIMAFQFEYNETWLYSRFFIKDVFNLLDGMPYFIGKISSKTIFFYREWHPEIERSFESDYLILHRDALDWFNYKIGSFNKSYYFEIEK